MTTVTIEPRQHSLPPETSAAAAGIRRRRLLEAATLLFLAAITIAVTAVNLHGFPTVQDDEGTYLSQAEWTRRGALAPYTYWYDHPPFGWMQIGALTWLPFFRGGALTVASGRGVAVVYAVASALLLYLLARRVGARWATAILTVLIFVCCPLSATFLRQVYLDNFATPWLLAALYFASSPRGRLAEYIAAGVSFAGCVLTKETTLLLLPAVVLAAWRSCDRQTRSFAMVGLGSSFLLCSTAYLLLAVLKGELFKGPGHVSLQSALEFQFFDRAGSGSVFDPSSSARQTVEGWLHTDSWLVVVGCVAAMLCLLIRRARFVGVAILIVGTTLLRNGYLPTMFIIVALPLLALATGLVTDQMISVAGRAEGRFGRPAALTGQGLVSVAVVGGLMGLAIAWQPRLDQAFTADNNVPHAEAVRFIRESTIPRSSRIVVDNTMWQDVYHAGFNDPWKTIWYYKVDLDTAAKKELPDGWRDINYILLTPFMKQDVKTVGLTTVQTAIEHSQVVARFGEGASAVELRKVVK
jgi:4-amino-4-deoxy-L-arabinose transferase-like glycosyltransferase